MTASLTPELAASITGVEMAFSTQRLLPAWGEIPDEFKTDRNVYARLAEAVFKAIFYGSPLPNLEITMREGYAPEAVNRMVRAHLQSYGPKHEHKMAGVAFLIYQAAAIQEV